MSDILAVGENRLDMEMPTAPPIKVEAYPISIDIPSQIATGKEFWASQTVFLPFKDNCRYFLSLALVKGSIECTAAEAWYVDEKWMQPGFFPRAYPISIDGKYTFRGIPKHNGAVYQIPAKATYSDWFTYPLPKGIYQVKSWCKFYIIKSADANHTEYEDYWWIDDWRGKVMGEVEVT